MRATIASIFFAAVAFAQQNPFNIPNGGYSNVQAGQPLNLSWKPTTGGSVTLVLRSGDSDNLAEGTEITSNAPNNGMFTWNVPSDITKGFTYTVQIISGSGDINYTPYFAIDSTNTAPSQTSVVATGAPTGQGAALPPVPQSLAVQQSSATSAASTMMATSMTGGASSEARTASSAPASASSMASMASASATAAAASNAASSGASMAGAAQASSTGASTNGAAAVKVGGGLLAGLAGAIVAFL